MVARTSATSFGIFFKNPPNSHVNPQNQKILSCETSNSMQINHLRRKNKFVKSGILVMVNSIK